MDPATVAAITSIALPWLFGSPAPQGPSAAEVAAALERQRREQEARTQRLLIGLGIAAVGGVAVWMLVRRK